MKLNNPKAGFRGLTFEKSLEMFDPSYKKPVSKPSEIDKKLADTLMELAKYRLLSKEEIELLKSIK